MTLNINFKLDKSLNYSFGNSTRVILQIIRTLGKLLEVNKLMTYSSDMKNLLTIPINDEKEIYDKLLNEIILDTVEFLDMNTISKTDAIPREISKVFIVDKKLEFSITVWIIPETYSGAIVIDKIDISDLKTFENYINIISNSFEIKYLEYFDVKRNLRLFGIDFSLNYKAGPVFYFSNDYCIPQETEMISILDMKFGKLFSTKIINDISDDELININDFLKKVQINYPPLA